MTCSSRNLAVVDPFRAVRRDFSKQFGMPSDSKQDGRVIETDNQVQLQIDLPGVDLANVSITVEDGLLTIAGSRPEPSLATSRPLFASSSFGDFQRTFRLHKSLDLQAIDAVMDLGVLTVTIPKRPEVLPQKVQIRSAASDT